MAIYVALPRNQAARDAVAPKLQRYSRATTF